MRSIAQKRLTAGGGSRRGGRAADDHGDDDVGHLPIGGGKDVARLKGELGLVDETYAAGGPGQGGNHALLV